LEDGAVLGEKASQCLAQAALHIMAIVMNYVNSPPPSEVKHFAAAARDCVGTSGRNLRRKYSESSTSMCVKHMLQAMDLVQDAVLALPPGSAQASSALRRLLDESVSSFQTMAQIGSKDAFAGLITILGQRLSWHKSRYYNYGVMNMSALAMAHLQRCSIRDEIPEDVEIESPGTLINSLMKRHQDNRYLAATYEQEGLHLLSLFEEQAAYARSAAALADVMITAHKSIFLLTTSAQAFDWAKVRYEEAGLAVPADILKERQVAEEYRVGVIQLLGGCGKLFVFGPIVEQGNEVIRRYLKDKEGYQQSHEPKLSDAVYNWAGRTPIYPERLRKVWLRIIADEDPAGLKVNIARVKERVANELPEIFTDRVVACASLQAADWVSRSKRNETMGHREGGHLSNGGFTNHDYLWALDQGEKDKDGELANSLHALGLDIGDLRRVTRAVAALDLVMSSTEFEQTPKFHIVGVANILRELESLTGGKVSPLESKEMWEQPAKVRDKYRELLRAMYEAAAWSDLAGTVLLGKSWDKNLCFCAIKFWNHYLDYSMGHEEEAKRRNIARERLDCIESRFDRQEVLEYLRRWS